MLHVGADLTRKDLVHTQTRVFLADVRATKLLQIVLALPPGDAKRENAVV